MLWITTTPGSAVQSKGSMVCMIGGVGNLPSKVARTKSIPAIDAMTSGGVTPYSILRAGWASMAEGRGMGLMMVVILWGDLFPLSHLVMPELDPGIHHFSEKMDCRA